MVGWLLGEMDIDTNLSMQEHEVEAELGTSLILHILPKFVVST